MSFKLFKNLNLGLKLNVVVALAFGVLLAAIIIITNISIGNLTTQTGQQRVEQETKVAQNRFYEAEQEMLVSARLMAATSGLIEAVAKGDAATAKIAAMYGAFPLDLDIIEVVDADGEPIVTITQVDTTFNATSKDALLSLSLLGIETTDLVSRKPGEEQAFLLAAVAPLRDTSGAIVGGVLVGRQVDEEFLAEINFNREDVHLALIRNGQIVVRHVAQLVEEYEDDDVSPGEEAVQFQGLALDETALEQALRGQTVIAGNSTDSTGNVPPHILAYAPLTVGGHTTAILGVMVRLDKLLLFQSRLITNMATVFILLTLAVVGIVALFAQKSISAPIGKLMTVAKRMAGGDYLQRAKVTATDEVGQLAYAFNEMAYAIQERETELQNFTASLEQRVESRTAELRAVNEQLLQEIGERKRAEEALRESEERLRQVISSISDHIYMTEFTADGDQLNRYLSPHIEVLTGYALEKFVADWSFWPSTVIHPDDRDAAAAQAIRFAKGQNSEVEYRLVRADGDITWVRDSGRIVKDPLNQSIFVYGVVSDVTERKQAETALKLSHQELQRANERLEVVYKIGQLITSHLQLDTLLNTLVRNTAQLLGTDTGVILLLDEATQTLTIQGAYGLSEHIVKNTRHRLGESIAGRVALTGQSIIANDLPNHPQFYNPEAVNEGLLAGASVPLKVGDKIIGTLDTHSKTDRYALGEEQVHLLSLLADQAAIAIENARLYESVQKSEASLAEARDQAMEASRLKGQLLANVSHDLRTPLGAISGYTEMLQAGVYGPLTDQQYEAATEIIDSTDHLLNFVNNLLNQARIESGKMILNIKPFAPAELLETVQSTAKALAQAKGLELRGDIAPNMPTTLAGDFYWLRQILVNLVGNAIKFTEQGTVQLSIYQADENHWAMQVSDTGPGIPAEAQSYIFDAFRQVDDAAIQKQHIGSGLGLSIVKQLTTLMGGQITLTSQVGQGSTFTVLLPLTEITEEI